MFKPFKMEYGYGYLVWIGLFSRISKVNLETANGVPQVTKVNECVGNNEGPGPLA